VPAATNRQRGVRSAPPFSKDGWSNQQTRIELGDAVVEVSDGVLELHDGTLAVLDEVARVLRTTGRESVRSSCTARS
jgi:hypothetical protein